MSIDKPDGGTRQLGIPNVLDRVVQQAILQILTPVSHKSLQRFKRRIRELNGRSWGVSMERRLSELRSYLRGWAGYFCLAMELTLFGRLDQWIRRRIRMCYWKRWRHTRTRSRELMRLGVPRRHAKSRQSYWHMARTIASGVGFTNAMLAKQGLLSLKHLWNELAPIRRTAYCGPAR